MAASRSGAPSHAVEDRGLSARLWPWLVGRPIAHRGLHGESPGPVENTIAAADAAVREGFAIECDVRLSRDGEAVVFHDATLERLTLSGGRVDARSAVELRSIAFRRGAPGIPSLATFLAAVADRVPVIVEIKSAFDGDVRLADRVAASVARHNGRIALKSFDVEIMDHLSRARLACPLGMVAETEYRAADWPDPSTARLADLRRHAGIAALNPDFLSWAIDDLPHPLPASFRTRGLPVMAWTVRTASQHARAEREADAAIFEGVVPSAHTARR